MDDRIVRFNLVADAIVSKIVSENSNETSDNENTTNNSKYPQYLISRNTSTSSLDDNLINKKKNSIPSKQSLDRVKFGHKRSHSMFDNRIQSSLKNSGNLKVTFNNNKMTKHYVSTNLKAEEYTIKINDELTNLKRGDKIGQGTFGDVYLCLRKYPGDLVVEKVMKLRGDEKSSNSLIKTFFKEAELLKSLRHEHIVQYLGCSVSEENKELRIYMEYMPGGSIYSIMKKFGGPLDEFLVRLYSRQILTALTYLHSENVLHLDIKGKNILVDSTGIVKLSDFGTAIKNYAQKEMITEGSPYWMAPEVIKKNKNVNWSADIWSFGCFVVEMLTGKPPFSHYKEYVSALYHIAVSDELPDLSETGVSVEAQEFVKRCMQRDPSLRPSAETLLKDPWVSSPEITEVLVHNYSIRRRRSSFSRNMKITPP